jgi:TonB family protein
VKIFTLFVFCAFCFLLSAQKKSEFVEFPEVDASFPGGIEAMHNFITTIIVYPNDCLMNGIEGKVYVSFVINTDGSIEDIRIEKGAHPSLDREAKRVISEMPDWIPTKLGDTYVRSRARLPIVYKLDNSVKKSKKDLRKSKNARDKLN